MLGNREHKLSKILSCCKKQLTYTQLTFSIPIADDATVALHPDMIDLDTLSIPDSFKNLLKNCIVQNPQLTIDINTLHNVGLYMAILSLTIDVFK